MFASLSSTPQEHTPFLHGGKCSLLTQSDHDPERLHKDGWGVGWYPAGRPRIIKSPNPVFKERGAFLAAARKARARISIIHLRWASNPLNLPPQKLFSASNIQPFASGKIIFAHNGTLKIPLEVRARLGKYAPLVRGNNDSKVAFWHFIKHYARVRDFRKAFENALAEFWTIWRRLPAKTRPPAPYKSMNIIASDGKTLAALCHARSKKAAICSPGWPYADMAWRLEKDRLLVSSEPPDTGHWNRLCDGQLLLARIAGGGLPAAELLNIRTGGPQ